MKEEQAMHTSVSETSTAHASRYLQQLCRHWSHRFAVEFNATDGTVDFGEGKALRLQADGETLALRLTAQDQPTLERMQEVVAEHLLRFAFKEALTFTWKAV